MKQAILKQDETQRHPSFRERRCAALLHLQSLFLGGALPFIYWQSKSKSSFIRHHGKQAVLLNGLWLLIATSHFLLAQLLHGVAKLQDWLYVEFGTPPDPIIHRGIELTLFYNEATLWLEGILMIGMALWMSQKTWFGYRSHFFFAKPKQPFEK